MPDFRTESLISFKEVWIEWKGKEFERLFVFWLVLLEDSFFYFLRAFIFVMESF